MAAPATPRKLTGKACVITGATSGIGLATARLLSTHGVRLAIMARDTRVVQSTAAELAPDTVTVTGDVARVDDLAALMHATNDAYGGIDVVVANAGIGRDPVFPASLGQIAGVDPHRVPGRADRVAGERVVRFRQIPAPSEAPRV